MMPILGHFWWLHGYVRNTTHTHEISPWPPRTYFSRRRHGKFISGAEKEAMRQCVVKKDEQLAVIEACTMPKFHFMATPGSWHAR